MCQCYEFRHIPLIPIIHNSCFSYICYLRVENLMMGIRNLIL